MRYKIGDEVVLKNGKKVEVEIVEEDSFYVVGKKGDFFLTKVLEDDIDHNKTAELKKEVRITFGPEKEYVSEETRKQKVLDHYNNELKKISWEKNCQEYDKALMKYGDDIIKPDHYKKNGMDLIDNFKNIFDEKEFRAVMKSNILRYTIRYENKNGIEDLIKANEFNKRLVEWEESLNV